jgi:hypothetical protein
VLRRGAAVLLAGLALLTLAGCGHDTEKPPKLGVCRVLSGDDIGEPSNDSPVVPCTEKHTAQTFAIGTLPASTGSKYDDPRHGTFAYTTCQKDFAAFLGADESQVLRMQLSWAWFRPSAAGWEKGARWYRCDVIGGPVGAKKLRDLPIDAKGLFSGVPPDDWLTCGRGATVASSVKVACSQPHDWRAVTTIKVGQPADPYPGDRIVQVRTRDYCQDSVGGWLHYPPDYDFGYSWFREAQWKAGNRRSVCWAKTDH